MNRDELKARLREIEESYSDQITPGKQKEAREIIRKLNACKCRECGKVYDRHKSRATWTGYCSAKCQHIRAKKCGYNPKWHQSEHEPLKRHGEIGDVFVTV